MIDVSSGALAFWMLIFVQSMAGIILKCRLRLTNHQHSPKIRRLNICSNDSHTDAQMHKYSTLHFCQRIRFINAVEKCTSTEGAEDCVHLGRSHRGIMRWLCNIKAHHFASASERRPATSPCTNTEISSVTPLKTLKGRFPQPVSTIIAGHIPMGIHVQCRLCHLFQRRSHGHTVSIYAR